MIYFFGDTLTTGKDVEGNALTVATICDASGVNDGYHMVIQLSTGGTFVAIYVTPPALPDIVGYA